MTTSTSDDYVREKVWDTVEFALGRGWDLKMIVSEIRQCVIEYHKQAAHDAAKENLS